MLSTATGPDTSDIHRWLPSLGSLPLKLVEHVEKNPCSSLVAYYNQVPQGEEPDLYIPSSRRQRRRIGDKEVMKFMQSRLAALDPKPVAQCDSKQDGKQVVNQFDGKTSTKSFPASQALGGHISRSHFVRDKNDPKQGNHACEVCHKSFPTGQALGGHKRFHYKGPLILKRKAPSTTTSSMIVPQENSPCHQTDCVKLFDIDIKKLSQAQEVPSITTCSLAASQEISQSPTGCVKLLRQDGTNQFTEAKEDNEINLDLTL